MSKKSKKAKQSEQIQTNNGGNTNFGVSKPKKSKLREKLDMYDMILANLYAGKSIIEPSEHLDNSQVAIGFSNISSETQISKYFTISAFPDYLQNQLIDYIRNACMLPGVKINFYFYGHPHKIFWDSAEMRSKMDIWSRYSQEHDGTVDVFKYRQESVEAKARNRIIQSTRYLNESELEHKRSLIRVSFIIEITARRDEESIINMVDSVKKLKEVASATGLKIRELRINMIDWIRAINPFSLNASKETESKLIKKVMTDDNLANFNSYKQGRVGIKGIPLGIDVRSYGPVLRQFKEDPDKAENWLICAETGGGKSMWIKSLLSYMMADGYTVCIMDYEGDEYTNLANYVREYNPDDVKIVSMGKGSAVYFDPCEIPELTGDITIDRESKESAISFINAIYRIIVHGDGEDFSTEEKKIMSTAIQRMYDSVGVTDNMNTWHRSKLLKLHDVYHEVKEMVLTKEFVDSDSNTKHKLTIIFECPVIFPTKSKVATNNNIIFIRQIQITTCQLSFAKSFKITMCISGHVNHTIFLYKAKLIVFSFGMKGASESATDPTILALKQLSVAYVNIQISNYCKYVKHYYNVKVWEEFQRWGQVKGSEDTIVNVITGGRKRGDVNFIVTNDLASILDENNRLSAKLGNNIQNYAIGRIVKSNTREKFCEQFDLQECLDALDRIAKASANTKQIGGKTSGSQNRYKYAFCVVLDDGNKAIVKSMLPTSILKSSLFKTGVQIKE